MMTRTEMEAALCGAIEAHVCYGEPSEASEAILRDVGMADPDFDSFRTVREMTTQVLNASDMRLRYYLGIDRDCDVD